ncbi:MAG: GTPase ObgE [Candidatus Shapirobacteria bacterium]|jgi:GTP-binding protein
MLIDEVHLSVKAGNGGRGAVHFFHDRHRPKGGPDGGDGGKGGSVYFLGVSDISKLSQFRHQKNFSAIDGQPGGSNQKTGKDGDDLTLSVPVGTVVSYDNGTQFEVENQGQLYPVAKGGRGGRGNYSFRSSTNQAPLDFTPGETRDHKNLFLKLKLIAHVGLIGLPNTGKTSLLNELTASHAKVANYPFTTLEPNLGVTRGNFIIADIPGLIEGASSGKGLGIKFLKHIERTRLLIHCLASDSPNLQNDYSLVRQELKNYSPQLLEKPEIIILTKSDLVSPEIIPTLLEKAKSTLAVSIIDESSLTKLEHLISAALS